MSSVRSYQDLEVWRRAMDLVVRCYELAGGFPRNEQYGLISQLQRAAVSVPANIAEGQGRNFTREYLHHLSIAYGSLMEVETHLHIAARLGYVAEQDLLATMEIAGVVGRLLNGLEAALERRLKSQT